MFSLQNAIPTVRWHTPNYTSSILLGLIVKSIAQEAALDIHNILNLSIIRRAKHIHPTYNPA